MTIPVVPGPFSFIGQLGQAAGEAGQQAIAQKQRDFEHGHIGASLMLQLIEQKLLKPEALSSPQFQESLRRMGIPPSLDQGNIVPRPEDELAQQRSELLKEYLKANGGITPEQSSHLMETGTLAGPEALAAERAKELAAGAGATQERLVTEATTPGAPVLAQAGQGQQFAAMGVSRGSRYLAQAMAEAPQKDRFGVDVMTPQHVQRAQQLAAAAGDTSVTPDLIAAAAEQKRQELSNEWAKRVTALGMLYRGQNTGAAANSPDRILNNSLQRVTGQLSVNRQRMGDLEKSMRFTTGGMKVLGIDPTPLTPQEAADPTISEYQRLRDQNQLLEDNFNDLQSVMGTSGLQGNAPAAKTAGVAPPVAKGAQAAKPATKPALTPGDLQRAKTDPKFNAWLKSKGYTVP